MTKSDAHRWGEVLGILRENLRPEEFSSLDDFGVFHTEPSEYFLNTTDVEASVAERLSGSALEVFVEDDEYSVVGKSSLSTRTSTKSG